MLAACISAGLLFAAASAHPEAVAPARGWRVIPSNVAASSASASVSDLLQGKDAWWNPETGPSQWFAFRLPPGKRFLVTFACSQTKPPAYAVLEYSSDSTNGADGVWEQSSVQLPKGRLDKFVFDRGSCDWWRLRFTFRRADMPSPLQVSDIGIYSLDAPGRKDYWLTIGASIQAQSIRNSVFKRMVRERFPGFDPVMFNLAVGGWKSSHLLAALPGFLKAHPDAAYVCIHIGGNNVTPGRPYPGGAEQLRGELVAILRMIKESGKIPILSRLSYRAYKGDKPVPPEENGSGPYVTNIYDPLIREHCPDFYDPVAGIGVVDAYGWFKAHPDELSPDGIHVNKQGAESWNRLWTERAGSVVYAGKLPTAFPASP